MSTITARLEQLLPMQPAPPSFAARPDTRFLFLHVPKTGGTSLLTMLGNAYGERHVRRLERGELDGGSLARLLAAPGSADIRCLVGHLAIHSLAGQRDRFRVFTILRHPVERILSLYRFIRLQPQHHLDRMRLHKNFGVEEFLANRSVEVYGQVRNGMCRALCNVPALSNRTRDAFWHERLPPLTVERSLATLRSIDFGLAEQMPETLALLRTLLRQPFDLTEHVDNASTPGRERTPETVQRLIELNSGDLALYHEAQSLFRARMQRLDITAAHGGADGLIRLEHGSEIQVRDLPGRQGFHKHEPKVGFSWIVGTEPARIAFAADPGAARLRLHIYYVTDGYPVGEIGLAVNGVPVAHHFEKHEGRWGMLRTEPFTVMAQNLLTLGVPYTLPARFLAPAAQDRRQLSIAVATLTLLAA